MRCDCSGCSRAACDEPPRGSASPDGETAEADRGGPERLMNQFLAVFWIAGILISISVGESGAALAPAKTVISYAGSASILSAAAGGADLRAIASFSNRLSYTLIARPDVKKPEDLRGKRFGVQAIGGSVWMGAVLGLEYLGLDAKRDGINILSIGDQTVLAQALEAGTIDATRSEERRVGKEC